MRNFPRLLLWAMASISCGSVIAADRVSLVFDQIGIVDLARIAYGELAQEPIVFTHEAVKAQETVSVTLRNVERDQAIDQVTELLRSAGYSAERRAGVVRIDKAKPAEETEMFYRPKYRSVAYLVDLLAPLFPGGAFTLQRGLSNFGQLNPVRGVQPSQVGAGAQPPLIDSGSSVYSMIDKNPDALVFRGTEHEHAKLRALLAQADTAASEILVKAVVFEISTDGADRSAFSIAAQILRGKLGLSIGTAAAGDYSVLFKGASFQAVFDALSSDRRFKAVSSPQLRVQDGATAQLMVGSETPVLGLVSYDNSGKAVQSVDYKSSGVILNLRPQIREESADLQISQQISNFIQTTTGVNNSPTLIKRELQTTVGITSDEVLVLGGLNQESSTKENAGLPFLPAWLSTKSDRHSNTEVMLILQATRM